MSTEPPSKKLFIISPIGDSLSENRKRSDQVKKFIIDPIAKKMGYKTCRSDGISQPGIITDQIIERLLNDELVIADLTNQNPNVFYELAVRHAIGKPVILMGLKEQKIPFDVSAQRVIFYDHTNLDDVDEAIKELEKQILAVESKAFIVDSPIKTHIPIEMTDRKSSENQQLHEMIAILRNQSEQLLNLENLMKVLSVNVSMNLLGNRQSSESHTGIYPGFIAEAARISWQEWMLERWKEDMKRLNQELQLPIETSENEEKK